VFKKLILIFIIILITVMPYTSHAERYVNITSVNFVNAFGRPLVVFMPSTIVRVKMEVTNTTESNITAQLTLSFYTQDGVLKQAQTTQAILVPNQLTYVTRGMLLPEDIEGACYLVAELKQVKDGYTSMLSSSYVFKR
jgi:hypothetical protein